MGENDIPPADIDQLHHIVPPKSNLQTESVTTSTRQTRAKTSRWEVMSDDNQGGDNETDKDDKDDNKDDNGDEDQLINDAMSNPPGTVSREQQSNCREHSSTPALPEGWELNDKLWKQLDAMLAQKHHSEMARLGQVSMYEFKREKNIACNKALLNALDLPNIVSDLTSAKDKGKGSMLEINWSLIDNDSYNVDICRAR